MKVDGTHCTIFASDLLVSLKIFLNKAMYLFCRHVECIFVSDNQYVVGLLCPSRYLRLIWFIFFIVAKVDALQRLYSALNFVNALHINK